MLWIQSHKSKPVDISTIKIAVFSASSIAHPSLVIHFREFLIRIYFAELRSSSSSQRLYDRALSAFSWTGTTTLPLVPMVFYRIFRWEILSCLKHALPSPQMTTYRPFWIWFRFLDEKAAAISAEVAKFTVNQQKSKCKQIRGTT